jgi:transposase
MPRRCTVCDHNERRNIDETLVTGASYRSVAKRFGLSESAVYRHQTEHPPAHLLKAEEVEVAARERASRPSRRKSPPKTLRAVDFGRKTRKTRQNLLTMPTVRPVTLPN